MWKICLSGTDVAVEGCESMTEEQVQEWMIINQENYGVESEDTNNAKYICMSV